MFQASTVLCTLERMKLSFGADIKTPMGTEATGGLK